jgi:hypothetical protein
VLIAGPWLEHVQGLGLICQRRTVHPHYRRWRVAQANPAASQCCLTWHMLLQVCSCHGPWWSRCRAHSGPLGPQSQCHWAAGRSLCHTTAPAITTSRAAGARSAVLCHSSNLLLQLCLRAHKMTLRCKGGWCYDQKVCDWMPKQAC